MRGLYAHASDRMRDELKAALQARWEDSLRERAAIDPHSPVPLLDELLAPKPISQIPPNMEKGPILRVGWGLSTELLTWSYAGERYWDRTSDLLGVK